MRVYKGEHLYSTGGTISCSQYGKMYGSFQKIKSETTIGYVPEGNEIFT